VGQEGQDMCPGAGFASFVVMGLKR